MGEYDLIELNEAFAAQYLAVESELNFGPHQREWGPSLWPSIACTGARIVATLVHEMAKRKSKGPHHPVRLRRDGDHDDFARPSDPDHKDQGS